MKSIKEDFSLMAILLIPVAVAINFTGFGIVKLLQIPIFLDSVGTVFISLIAGPWIGITTAVITSLITGSFSPEYFAFMPVSIIMALCMGFLTRFKLKNMIVKTFFLATGDNIWKAVFSTNLITETTDKIITAIIAMSIIKAMSPRYLIKFNYGKNYIKSDEKN